MRVMTKWALLIGTALLTLWAIGQQPAVTNELFAWVSNLDPYGNIYIVWQELFEPRRTDLFQIPVSLLPKPNVGMRIVPGVLSVPDPNHISPPLRQFVGRPQISADGRWIVFYGEDGQVYIAGDDDPADDDKDGKVNEDPIDTLDNDGDNKVDEDPPIVDEDPINGVDDDKDGQLDEDPTTLVSYKRWQDSDGDGFRDSKTVSTISVLPAISGSGRFVVFLSQDPDLNDPAGDGTGSSVSQPSSGQWIVYIHDRDADSNGIFDEAKVGGTTTRFLPRSNDPNTPLFVRLTEVRLSLDQTGRALAFSVFNGTNWQLWYVADVQAPNPTLVAQSSAPFSIPSLAGSRLAFTASGQFQFAWSAQPSPPGIYVVDTNTNQTVSIQTNGVNGMPMLSRDGNSLAFHSTGTAYSLDGKQWWLLTDIDANGQPDDYNGDKIPDFDRNAVDDVFMFDLTQNQPRLTWSSLILRANLLLPPFTACINPALPSSSVNLIAFQEIVNGVSRVRVVNLPNTVLR
jgi:hypothetical protein